MTKTQLSIGAFAIAALGIFAALLFAPIIQASGTFTSPTQPTNTYKNFTFFSATTTNATSTNVSDSGSYLVIAGAKKVTMYFTHGGTATTSTTGAKFNVQTTRDGVNWDYFNKLIAPDNTATSTYTIQGATSTAPVTADISKDTFYAIRCISTEIAGAAATDGEQTCQASVEF